MKFTIREIENNWQTAYAWSDGPVFEVTHAGGSRLLFGLKTLRRFVDADADEFTWDQAERAWLLQRLTALIEHQQLPEREPGSIEWIEVNNAEMASEIADLTATSKLCDWQVDTGRDLFCVAAKSSEDSELVELRGRPAAPTHEKNCLDCDVPDTRVLCSAFSHPRTVASNRLADTFDGAICRNGHGLIEASPTQCQAGGHDCWERVVEPGPTQSKATVSPTELLEALDHLDAEWRAQHGKRHVLVRSKGAEAMGSLVLDCTDQAAFRDRVGRLGDVIDQLTVDDDLLADDPPLRSLARLDAWADARLPDRMQPDAKRAIGQLRSLKKLRDALSHSAHDKVPAAMSAVGVSHPVQSWPRAWNQVRLFAMESLHELRRIVRALGTETD